MRSRVPKISRWALAPVVVAKTVAIAIRLILKLDLDEALEWKTCRGAIGSAGATRIKVKAISMQRF